MGGFYERLVGLVKRSLRKSIGRRMLTLIQLQTVLKEAEAVVNCRPLVYVDDDVNSNFPLTPGHFLSLNPMTISPAVTREKDDDFYPHDNTSERLLNVWKNGHKLLDQFWKLWRDEYLANLRERSQHSLRSNRIKSPFTVHVGDVVLVKDNLPRGCWKIGRIVESTVSRDGNIRSVKVRLPSGRVIGRPLNLIYPVECSVKSGTEQGDQMPSSDVPECRARPVRKAAIDANQRIKEQLHAEGNLF